MFPARRKDRTNRWCRTGDGDGAIAQLSFAACAGLAFVASFIGAPGTSPRFEFGPAAARAEYPEGIDSDADGLSDEFERFSDTNADCADTDGDGYDDGAEWVLRSDPNDEFSLPDPGPAVRAYAYEAGGALRLSTTFYPADLDLIEGFAFVAASPEFTDAPEGDPGSGLGVIELSDVVPALATNVCTTAFLGLGLASFDMDFDLSLMKSAPLVFGWAVRLAGDESLDQLFVGVEGATNFVVASPGSVAGVAAALVAQPLQPVPPPAEEQPEYCAIGCSDGVPVGVATLEFTVTSAACAPDGLLYCIDTDCTALADQTFLMLDYGYLQGKLDD